MFKEFEVTVNVHSIQGNSVFMVNTNDLRAVKVKMTIKKGVNPVDLTGMTIRLAVKKPDRKTVFQDGVVTDAVNGKCEVILDSQAYVVAGSHEAEVMIYTGADAVAVTSYFTYIAKQGILNDGTVESTNEFQSITKAINDAEFLIEDMRTNGTGIDAEARSELETVATQLAETGAQVEDMGSKVKDVVRTSMKPYFIEYFASFNKYGLGTPTGIANYTGGKYVLTVRGNAGDTFVTVISGNIADAGTSTQWACVIKNDDGLFDGNRVMGTDGINKVNLLKPLKRNITSGLLGNLHDAALGQHYTELGYYAFAQHLYFAKPRYSERNNVLAQFLEDDASGKWVTAGFTTYNLASSMVTPDNTLRNIGGKVMSVNIVDGTSYAEWQETIDNNKGYLEAFIGCSVGSVKADFYLDGLLVDSKTINREVERVVFPFEYAKTGKIKITGLGGYPQSLLIGRVTWFTNEKYSKNELIKPDMKVAYIGDSWGEFHNKATTRELLRLMTAAGGTPTVLDFSKGGHTSTYAKVWFDQYIIQNKPDIVIIEYFTNDFNSISGAANVGTFLNPDGVQQDMSIANLAQYVSNMQYMIDKAIENGIQPIVVMPASTNSISQVQGFGDKANDIWNGAKITNDSPTFKSAIVDTVTADKITSKSSIGVGSGTLRFASKEINSSARKGNMSDTETGANITGGDIHGFYNNGVRKAGVKHNGTVDANYLQTIVQASSIGANASNRGMIYLENSAGTSNVDVLKIVIQLADGTWVTKKIQLID